MYVLYTICKFICETLRKVVEFLPTVPGLIVTALGTVGTFFGSVFADFNFWSDIADWLDTASQHVNTLGAYLSETGCWSVIINWLAVDDFIRVCMFVLSGTIGLTIAVTITLFISLVSLLPVTLGIKALTRSISVMSGGFVSP